MTKQPSEYRARRALSYHAYLPKHALPYTWQRAQAEALEVLAPPYRAYEPEHAGRRA